MNSVHKSKVGRVLALIPAKAASVRLPRKNVSKLLGKSLLQWAIDAARKSDVVDQITVSTEDREIAEEARANGVDVPFMRPAHLARDPYGVVDVALHALEEWERLGEHFQTLMILLPTSPLRSALDIRGALNQYLESKVDFLHSVSKEDHSPLSSLILKNGLLTPLHPEWINRTGAKATSETPQLVRANGAITIVDVVRFREEKNYYAYPLGAYEMPWERSVDVDTQRDLMWAEFVVTHLGVGDA